MIALSIIIPVYFNKDNLQPLYTDLKEKVLDKCAFSYELLFVDDGSSDNSWSVIQSICESDAHARAFRLSRNFGSHAAILCGLSHARGECAVVKAADLQEPSELLLSLYESWQEGNNVVLAVRDGRREARATIGFANLYYEITRKFALPNMPKHGFDVYLIDRKVIDALVSMNECDSALTGQILWSGFRTALVPYVRQERTIGKSRWTLKKKIRLVTNTLFSFSNVPITAISVIGAASCIGAFIWIIIEIIAKLSGRITEPGFTLLFIFQLFSFGVTMLTLGILGEYLWRNFDSSRNRPVYIVEDAIDGQSAERDVADAERTDKRDGISPPV